MFFFSSFVSFERKNINNNTDKLPIYKLNINNYDE